MKRILVTLSLVSCVALANAQGSGTLTLGASSQEIWRGTLLNDGLTFVPKFDYAFGTGTHVTVRGALVMDGDGIDEWRFGIHHSLDLVAATLTFGATFYDREVNAGDTSEVWASARMKWLVPFDFLVAHDIDKVDGTYVRASTGASLGAGAMGANVDVAWKLWLGWADDNYAANYGATSAGLADAGGSLSASFSLQEATVTAWAKWVTLVDDNFTTFTGDRSNFAIGASVGWRF